jgi:hypothetical protein
MDSHRQARAGSRKLLHVKAKATRDLRPDIESTSTERTISETISLIFRQWCMVKVGSRIASRHVVLILDLPKLAHNLHSRIKLIKGPSIQPNEPALPWAASAWANSCATLFRPSLFRAICTIEVSSRHSISAKANGWGNHLKRVELPARRFSISTGEAEHHDGKKSPAFELLYFRRYKPIPFLQEQGKHKPKIVFISVYSLRASVRIKDPKL